MNATSILPMTPAAPQLRNPRVDPLSRSRTALRRGDPDLAEGILHELGDALWSSAAGLNLLGLVAESRDQWRNARRCWGRSLRADRRYAPARQNLCRYYELFQFGRTRVSVAFGDEAQLVIEETHRDGI